MSDGIQSLELSVHNLIQRFIERQQVTLTAFRALRPAIVEADHPLPQASGICAMAELVYREARVVSLLEALRAFDALIEAPSR